MEVYRCIAMALACAASQAALAAPETAGTWTANARYRHEHVDDDAFTRSASADTLRLRLGWSRSFTSGFALGLEGEGVAELGSRFNSGANGETTFPAVADARATAQATGC